MATCAVPTGRLEERGSPSSPAASPNWLRLPAGDGARLIGAWVRPISLAAALIGGVEVVLHRVVTPVLAHVPSVPASSSLPALVRSSGTFAVDTTAVLVLLATVALVAGTWRRAPVLAGLLGVAAVSTMAAAMLTSAAALAHLAVMTSVVGVVGFAAPTGSRLRAAALASVAVAVAAGQWPLLVEAIASATGVAGGAPASLRTLMESAIALALMLFVIDALADDHPVRASWLGATFAGLAAAILLALVPDYSAIVSVWAIGVTLSLPSVVYIVAAASLGWLLVAWLAQPSTRHLVAGLALLAVAGLQPTLVHHNLTALIGLALLAIPAIERVRPQEVIAFSSDPGQRGEGE